MDKRVGFGLYQSCVSVFVLLWCRWGVGKGLRPWSGRVGCCYVCVNCESGASEI